MIPGRTHNDRRRLAASGLSIELRVVWRMTRVPKRDEANITMSTDHERGSWTLVGALTNARTGEYLADDEWLGEALAFGPSGFGRVVVRDWP